MANGNNGNTLKWAIVAVSMAANIALAVMLAMSGARGKTIEETTKRSYSNESRVTVVETQFQTLERTVQRGFDDLKDFIRERKP